ncbi:hypothetical protein B0H21DRAFT_806180 [Amylocystis lapponica]|nr:hypothetical protein B0H21DRAFT_806180 [Amylocystis lapponica]
MPGPRNMRKKKQTQKARRSHSLGRPSFDNDQDNAHRASDSPTGTTADISAPPPLSQPVAIHTAHGHSEKLDNSDAHTCIPEALTKTPFIHDPGNGPRVRDARAFLASSFASPPSLDDPLCAEFAQDEVLQMLCSVLPMETATILWYNKSRRTARVCPACQRLYRLGDVLPEHVGDPRAPTPEERISPFLYREQELSGLCSSLCFVLAAFNFPGAIRSTWGRMAEELDDATWDLLDGPGQQQNDVGLGMLLKMTRCHDLGLAQLFFPDLDVDVDVDSGEESGRSRRKGWRGCSRDFRCTHDGASDVFC